LTQNQNEPGKLEGHTKRLAYAHEFGVADAAAWIAPTPFTASFVSRFLHVLSCYFAQDRRPPSCVPCMCEALDITREDVAVTAFECLFADRGLPHAIRSDNGTPFASPNGGCGSELRLSA
jgi:hypothetical protein